MWEKCKNIQDYIISLRRDLHQIPEIGKNLPDTQAYIAKELDSLGISYKKNQGDSGIIGEIKGGKSGKTILLRADIDALPIQENTGLPYCSKNEGCMHACGHDAHTAMLLGALRVLQENREELNGNVRFVFQTSEEQIKGAPISIAEGAVDGVDAVFGTHIGSILDPKIPSGKLIVVPGCCMASVDRFVLNIKGVGCHGSTPEKGIDPITIASNIVISLQTVIAREISALQAGVLTLGKIAGGCSYNAIPNEVVIEGTIRTLDPNVRQYIAKRIEEISTSVANTFRGSCDVEIDWGAPPVINNSDMAEFAANTAKRIFGEDEVITSMPAPNMGGEDFAYYLEKVPGAFMFLSSANPEKHTDIPHHNPKFDIDEDVLYKGSEIFVALAEEFL